MLSFPFRSFCVRPLPCCRDARRALSQAIFVATSILAGVLITPAHGVEALHEGLSLPEALQKALNEAPSLRAASAQTNAARAAAIPAGALPDPQLLLGLDNVPVEGANQFQLDVEPMTMQRIGVMQSFPNAAKRQAREQSAAARIALMQAYEIISRQRVQEATAQAWLARWTLEQQLALLDSLATENHLFDAAVRAQLAAGKSAASDTVLPRQEAAWIAERRDALTAQVLVATAQLRRFIGDAAARPLAGDLPEWPLQREALLRQLPLHPVLLPLAPQSRLLDAEIQASAAATEPDWALEFGYLNRDPAFGDMIMLQVRIDLPLFTRSRQHPLIAAKRAERDALTADIEANQRELVAQLDSALAQLQRLQAAEQRYRELLLPLAEEKIALELAAWRSGKGALIGLIAARREQIEARLATLTLTGERLQLTAQLHFRFAAPTDEQLP